MRELLILLLIAAAGYFAYDDYYKQRPALQQAQAEIEQLRQNATVPADAPARRYAPARRPARPEWFQKRVEQGSSLDSSRQHTQKDERASTPQP